METVEAYQIYCITKFNINSYTFILTYYNECFDLHPNLKINIA